MSQFQKFYLICEYVVSGLTLTELIIFIITYLLVMLWCKHKCDRRPFEKLDAELSGPSAYPIIGSGLHFIGRPEHVMDNLIKIHRTYGPEPFRIWMGKHFNVVISKPEDVQIILNSSKALNKSHFYKFFGDLIGEGLFSAPADKWRKNRRMIGPVFQTKNLKQFFPVFNEKTKILIENLKEKVDATQPFDLLDYLEISSLKTICHSAMGYDVDIQSTKGRDFAFYVKKALEKASMRVYKPWLHSNIIFSIYAQLTGLHDIYSNAKKLPNDVIKKTKQAYTQKQMEINEMSTNIDNTHENKINVLLDTLFDLNKKGAKLSDDEIRDEVMTMMIGGTDTSAITECFCLLLLAIHPEIQDKVFNEINNVLGNKNTDQPITIEDTQSLVYLEQVLKETLRLFPIGPVYDRELEDQVQISSGNYMLLKGTICTISPLVTHNCPELYPNPETFNPDNFTQENIAKRHKYSFLAFSGGPRGCIGYQYALSKMKIVVASVIRNFSIHTDVKMKDIKLTLVLVMRSKNGFPVTIHPRNKMPSTL